MMKLLTKELVEKFAKVGCQHDKELHEIKVLAKYFHPFLSWTRYATEYYPEEKLFYGLVEGDFVERGTFSLAEFEDRTFGIPFERDLYFTPCNAKDLWDEIAKRRGGYM